MGLDILPNNKILIVANEKHNVYILDKLTLYNS